MESLLGIRHWFTTSVHFPLVLISLHPLEVPEIAFAD